MMSFGRFQVKLTRATDRLTVLHIAPTPFFSNRGCHIRIRNEIEALKRISMRVILCTYHHGNSVEGIDIRRIQNIPGYSQTTAGYSPYKFLADIRLFFLTLKTVLSERPHILHGHLHEGALIGWAVKTLMFRQPMTLIMDMQGSLSGELAAYGAFGAFKPVIALFRFIEHMICRLPNAIVCSSENAMTSLARDFHIPGKNRTLIGDVVPAEFFGDPDPSRLRLSYGIPNDKRILIYAGSLLPAKGIDTVLDAIREISMARNDVFFILAGYPMEAAREYVRSYQLTDICCLPGEVAYSDLPKWLALADIGMEPKQSDSGEASGKLMHYMAAGLPVVCYDLPLNRLLADESAYYADPNRSNGFVNAIERALADPAEARQKGIAARHLSAERFSMKQLGPKLADVYFRNDSRFTPY
jgi:glycosyltransferase involved in cell wall biosynthesis